MACGPPGSSVRGILQARILEGVATPSSRDLPHPGTEPACLMSPALAGGSLPLAPPVIKMYCSLCYTWLIQQISGPFAATAGGAVLS